MNFGSVVMMVRPAADCGSSSRARSRAAAEPDIAGPELCVRRADGGQHQLLHEPLDKGRFAAAHRAHHTDVDIPAGACADLATDAVLFLFFQSNSPLPVALRTAPVGVGVLVVSYEKGALIMPEQF